MEKWMNQYIAEMKKNYQSKLQKEKLNILQIGALGLPVRNDLKYAGTERVISYLDKEFVRRGHNSMFAGPGDSELEGKLYATIPKSLWAVKKGEGGRDIQEGTGSYSEHHRKVIDIVKNVDVDVLHDHPGMEIVHSPEYLSRKDEIKDIPILTTLHGKYFPETKENFEKFKELIKRGYPIHFNAISYSQKKEFEDNTGVEIKNVVYHGIPLEIFPFQEKPQDYLFSLGRICEEKGQHIAIETAKKTKRPLIIAGEVHSTNQKYYEEKVKPSLDFSIYDLPEDKRESFKNDFLSKIDSKEDIIKEGQIYFIGSVDDKQKSIGYKNSSAFLMPITWPEPFGLVMVESMATGTPVVAFNYGSVKEVVDHGKTGYVIDKSSIKGKDGVPDLEKMVNQMSYAVDSLSDIKRKTCRKRIKDFFSIEKEAENYLRLYDEIRK